VPRGADRPGRGDVARQPFSDVAGRSTRDANPFQAQLARHDQRAYGRQEALLRTPSRGRILVGVVRAEGRGARSVLIASSGDALITTLSLLGRRSHDRASGSHFYLVIAAAAR